MPKVRSCGSSGGAGRGRPARRDDTPAVAVDPVVTTPTAPAGTGSVPDGTQNAPVAGTSDVTAPAASEEPTTTQPLPADAEPSTTTTEAPTTTAPPAPATVEYVAAGKYAGPEWVGDRTAPIVEPLADGLYFADELTSDGTTVTLTLVQRIRGQACVDEFGDGVETSVVYMGPPDRVGDVEAYRVPADEFIRLAAGQAPSAGAPEAFSWTPFGVFVEISGGRVVSIHQQFQS